MMNDNAVGDWYWEAKLKLRGAMAWGWQDFRATLMPEWIKCYRLSTTLIARRG